MAPKSVKTPETKALDLLFFIVHVIKKQLEVQAVEIQFVNESFDELQSYLQHWHLIMKNYIDRKILSICLNTSRGFSPEELRWKTNERNQHMHYFLKR